MHDIFLPVGYPHSVTPDYIKWVSLILAQLTSRSFQSDGHIAAIKYMYDMLPSRELEAYTAACAGLVASVRKLDCESDMLARDPRRCVDHVFTTVTSLTSSEVWAWAMQRPRLPPH
jgi:hypothetical protein